MEAKPPTSTPAPSPTKQAMDVASPAVVPQHTATVAPLPVRPAPGGEAPLMGGPASPLRAPALLPLQSKPAQPKQSTPAAAIASTILVMLALSALAMLAYMHSKA